MIALSVGNVRDFMNKLLLQTTFDKFYLLEAEVITMADFRIDGELNEDFYSSDEKELLAGRKYALWQEIKPVVYGIIRGKKLPISFNLVLQLSDESTGWLLKHDHMEVMGEQLRGLYLNIRYHSEKVSCITGLSYNTFVMDKTLEHVWDDTARQFLKQSGIEIEDC